MKNKIGLVTFFRDNYGSELQCYATKTFLKNNGYECDVIYEYSYGTEKIKNRLKHLCKIALYTFTSREFAKNRKEIKQSEKNSGKSLTEKSRFYLDWFCETVLQPRGLEYSLLSDKRFENEYDYFIAGSDQIWGGGYLVRPFMFLEFAPDNKKIALCPSFGVEELKRFNRRQFKKSIAKFLKLSVREQSGQKIISELTGRQVPILADPVMLLNSEDWHNFAKSSSVKCKNYVFVHFLGKPGESAIQFINHIADKYHLDIICFANEYEEYSSLKNSSFVERSPYEYVSLIENAAYVFTDSFHTSHFSIIFNKRFMTFDRNYGHGNKQSTRIQNLFSIYKCDKRFVCDGDVVSESILIDSTNFDVIRKEESATIQHYLLDSLQTQNDIYPPNGLKNANECTGCMACSSICPKHAISVTYSEFGYRLPVIDSNLCINCGLCEKVCRSNVPLSVHGVDDAYIAFNSNKELCLKSASGGVFSCLAKSFIEQGGVVAGASLSFEGNDIAVKHIIVKNADDLTLILGSKYVESDCSGIYYEIEKYLKSDISVLFCGTSCQVKALYGYLETKHISIEKLFTIDLICHGVPGIQFFKDYLNYVGFKITANSELAFRSKNDGVIIFQFSWKARPDDSTVINIPASNSSYYDLFLHSASYREQCYQCEYASDHKPGDITIGDYFEAKNDYPALFSPDGPLFDSRYLNCLLVNSEKGQKLIEILGKDLIRYPVSRRRVQLSHSNLCKPSTYGKLRLDTIDKYQFHGIAGVEKMYRKIFAANSAIAKIKKIGTYIKKSKRK